MKKVLILTSIDGDWEGIYVDGDLKAQAHTLGEGGNRLFLLRMAEVHNFKADDVVVAECNHPDDSQYLMQHGYLPLSTGELKGNYNGKKTE